jgi:hypothetical protein
MARVVEDEQVELVANSLELLVPGGPVVERLDSRRVVDGVVHDRDAEVTARVQDPEALDGRPHVGQPVDEGGFADPSRLCPPEAPVLQATLLEREGKLV